MIFVDGLGLAPASHHNPLSRVALPTWNELLGGAPTTETLVQGGARRRDRGVIFEALDARLGVEGLPQSATGQTALFTGKNAPRLLGRHVPALPGPRLRKILAEHSVFARVAGKLGEGRGRPPVAFANAFTDERRTAYSEGRGRPSASVAATLAGGAILRSHDQLRRGEAVSWDITGRHFGVPLRQLRSRERRAAGEHAGGAAGGGFGLRSAEEAGRCLARVAERHRLTLYETFLTDLAGHGRYVIDASTALSAIDGMLRGVLQGATDELTVVLTSDHGNVEDDSTPMHTTNPVPLIAWGGLAESFEGMCSLLAVAPTVERAVVD